MSHVSQKSISSSHRNALLNQLFTTIANLDGRSIRRGFMFDLLTSTERLMLAKRFAVLYFLEREVPWQVIEKKLNVSTSTIVRLAKVIDRGGFPNIRKVTKAKSSLAQFAEIVNLILLQGSMSRGRGRYDWVDGYR